ARRSWLAGAPGGAGGGSWELGKGNRSPRTPGVVGDHNSQLQVLAPGQPSRWVKLAPGLRLEGSARAEESRPVSSWLAAEVSWRPEPRARCTTRCPTQSSSPFLPWR
ncbi:RIKEN cDNA 9630013D21, isoform CRA_b, partial [Mus musculus]